MSGAQLVAALNLYAPTFLVGTLVGGSETAWFGASHRVVISLSIFGVIYHFNLYPTLTRQLAGGARRDLEAVVRASYRTVAWVSIGGALFLMLFAKVLLSLAFGNRFVAAAPTFEILVWFLPISLLSGHARWLLVAGGRQVFVLLGQLTGAVTTVLLGVPLIQRYGAPGAAATMLGAAVALWIATHLFAVRAIGPVPGVRPMVVPAALAALICVAVQRLGLGPWVGAPAGAAVFLGLAVLLDRRLLPDLRLLAQVKSDVAQSSSPVPDDTKDLAKAEGVPPSAS